MDPLAAFLPGATSSPYIPALNRANSQVSPKRDKQLLRRSSTSHLHEGSVKFEAKDQASFTPDLGSSSSSRLAALSTASAKLFSTKQSLVKDVGTSSPAYLYCSPSLAKSDSSWTKGNASLRERLTGRSTPPLSRSSTTMSRSSDPRHSSRSTSSLSIHAESEPEQVLHTATLAVPAEVTVLPQTITCSQPADAARAESPTLPESPPIDEFLDLQSTPSRKCSLGIALFHTLGLLPDGDTQGALASSSTLVGSRSPHPAQSDLQLNERPLLPVCRAASGSSASIKSASSGSSGDRKKRPQALPQLQMPPDQPLPVAPVGSPGPPPPPRSLSLPERQVLPHFPLPPTPLPSRPPKSTLRVMTNIPTPPVSSRRLSVQSTVSRGSSASRGSLETAGPMTPEVEESSLPTVFEHHQRGPWGQSVTKHHEEIGGESVGIHDL